MQILRSNWFSLIPLAAVVVACLATIAGHCQQLQFGAATSFELTAPQLDLVSGTTQARLAQVRALMADRQWDAAVDLLRDLADEDSKRVVTVGDGRYVSLPTYCQMQLARMPAEGLAAYRRREDPTAERWYRAGLANRDERLLDRVVGELFCSSWGDDALLASGELALERADYAAARRAWQAISPLLRDPRGRTTWQALGDVDVRRAWSKIEPRWRERTEPPDWLAYPDTDLDLAAVRARLVLVSIREGDFERAALELEAFRRFHPQAAGRLAGQVGPYWPALEQMLARARQWPVPAPPADWPTFAGSPNRNGIAGALARLDFLSWSKPVELPTNDAPRLKEQDILGCFPLAVDGRVYFCDARNVYSVDLATGGPAMTPRGVLYRLDAQSGPQRAAIATRQVAAGQPRHTMTVAGGVLYARLGDEATGRTNPTRDRRDERLVGLDLSRDGLLTFQARPEDGTWSFDGAPLADDRNVYVAMRHSDVMPHVYVAAFDASTGRRAWRTSIAAADTPAAGAGDEITHTLLTLVGQRIFVNTNLGVVAALDAADGRLCWLRRYDRTERSLSLGRLPAHFQRDPAPCVDDRGLLFVAPADTPAVFALDADTGRAVWAVHSLADATQLLGVVDGRLIASGHRLWAIDATSGRIEFVWPESEHAGIRGLGRGVVAGGEIYWPTREAVYVFDVTTGQQTRRPLDISPFTDGGANLVAAEGHLLVAGRNRLMAFGPHKPPPSPPPDAAERTEAVAERERDTADSTSGDS
jgi:outer membrane protein assembly factor BamB